MAQYSSSKNFRHQIRFLENVPLHEIEFEDWQEKLVAYLRFNRPVIIDYIGTI